jgi:hypothetical protein
MTDVDTRRRPPLTAIAGGVAILGATLLIITPWPAMATVELFSESVDVRPGGERWGIVATGLVAAALGVLTLRTRNPLWTTLAVLPGILAIGWSGWWVFSKIAELAQFADSVSLGPGGIAFVLSGPVLIASSLLALLAARQAAPGRP